MSEEKPEEYADYDMDQVRSEMRAHGVDGPLISRLEQLIEDECAGRAVKLLDPHKRGYTVIRCSAVKNDDIRDIIKGSTGITF